jgi:hypothetical protein
VLAELRSAFAHLEAAVTVADTTLSHDELGASAPSKQHYLALAAEAATGPHRFC